MPLVWSSCGSEDGQTSSSGINLLCESSASFWSSVRDYDPAQMGRVRMNKIKPRFLPASQHPPQWFLDAWYAGGKSSETPKSQITNSSPVITSGVYLPLRRGISQD
jgi:hypothetical protein